MSPADLKLLTAFVFFVLRFMNPGSDCSRNFTSPSGLIESPGFPDKYPHNLECSFIIVVPPSMDVTLAFLTFDLENDPLPGGDGDCKYDWLEVWDGIPGGEGLIHWSVSFWIMMVTRKKQ